MGAKGSREAAATATDKPRAEPSVNVVTAATTDAPGEKAAAPAPRKNFGAYGCAVSLAVQASAKQKQVRESRERSEAAAKAS